MLVIKRSYFSALSKRMYLISQRRCWPGGPWRRGDRDAVTVTLAGGRLRGGGSGFRTEAEGSKWGPPAPCAALGERPCPLPGAARAAARDLQSALDGLQGLKAGPSHTRSLRRVAVRMGELPVSILEN